MKYLVKTVYVKSLLVHYIVDAKSQDEAARKAVEGKYIFAHHSESDTEPQLAQTHEISDRDAEVLISTLEASDEPAPISTRLN